jgi:creatinine amidohydrolase
MDQEVFLERMTWPEITDRIAAGHRRAIICAASSEQHGPHLPEATDALIGAALAERLARRLGDALVAPVIRPGCSDHHMTFAGSLTISPRLLMDLLDAYLGSLRRHGFESFFVFSSHGGNFGVLGEWEKAWKPENTTVGSDLLAFMETFRATERRFGRDDGINVHADLCETSMMLALHPDLVRLDRVEPGFTGEFHPDQLFEGGMRALSPNGVLGNPVGASRELGEALLEDTTSWLAAQLAT